MKTADVIAHFGSRNAAAKALEINRSAISQWGPRVPLGTAARLEKITGGALVLDLDQYQRPIPHAHKKPGAKAGSLS